MGVHLVKHLGSLHIFIALKKKLVKTIEQNSYGSFF